MIVRRISEAISRLENLTAVYALVVVAVTIVGLVTLPLLEYRGDALYPKAIDRGSSLDPYDRGGTPFNATGVKAQYIENSPYAGYVTAYLTPLSLYMAQSTLHMGTTIVSHPGGIIDEILYNTRGLDTVVETSILFAAFAIASYIFRRRD